MEFVPGNTTEMYGKYLKPLDQVNGFLVRPGFYDINGATALSGAVNFTVYSHYATSCEPMSFT